MNVQIKFATDNAAFEDSYLMEITRVLRRAKDVLLDSENQFESHSPLFDSNGNVIGHVEITK